jgi:hypothetical protein
MRAISMCAVLTRELDACSGVLRKQSRFAALPTALTASALGALRVAWATSYFHRRPHELDM